MYNIFFTRFAKVCAASAFVLLCVHGADAATRLAPAKSPNITVNGKVEAILSVTYWDDAGAQDIKLFEEDGHVSSVAKRTLKAKVVKAAQAKIKFASSFKAKDGSKEIPFYIDFYPQSIGLGCEKYNSARQETDVLNFKANQEVKFVFCLENPNADFEVGNYSAPVHIEFVAEA